MNSTPTAIVSEHAKSTLSVQAELLLVVIIIDLIFGSFITIGNASLFTTIYRDPCRCLRTPSVFLIANLSIADFFMGIISYLRAGELTYKYCGLVLSVSRKPQQLLPLRKSQLTFLRYPKQRFHQFENTIICLFQITKVRGDNSRKKIK